MGKRVLTIVLAAVLMLTVCGCGGGGSGISVQRADSLRAVGLAGERYVGMVVNDNVVDITRDSTKTIAELYVAEGDTVKAGDKLFTYDSDALELDLEKTRLEVEKMENEQGTYASQQEKLEKQLSRTWSESEKVRLTLEINTLKTTQMENDYQIAAKNKEITRLEEMLQNIDITAPVDGTVRKIDEEGQSGAYITIQQSGAFRVKGRLNEMSMGSLNIGSQVTMHSRLDDSSWTGTVVSIDADDGSDNNNNVNYGNYDAMTSSSSYVFYVELDSTDGLLLGQHVYMEVTGGEMPMEGLYIPESFLTDVVNDEETWEMSAVVFAANDAGKLEKRTVKLGMYDGMTGCYEITEGIDGDTWLADPTNPACAEGAAVTYRDASDFSRTGE